MGTLSDCGVTGHRIVRWVAALAGSLIVALALSVPILVGQGECELRGYLAMAGGAVAAIVVLLALAYRHSLTEENVARLLRLNQARFREAIETTADGFWSLSPEGRTLEVNAALVRMLGYRREDILASQPTDYTDSDGALVFVRAMAKMADQLHCNFEIDLIRRDGFRVAAAFRCTSLRGEEGEKLGFFAFVTDFSERKRAEQALREGKERLRQFFDAAFEGLVMSEMGIILDTNQAYCDMVGATRDQVIGTSIDSWTAPEGVQLMRRMVATQDETPYVLTIVGINGRRLHVEVRGRRVMHQGRPVRISALHDITAYTETAEALRQVTLRDELTGAFNRRAFHDMGAREFERFRRYGRPLALLVVDADHFKAVNDTYGHAVGDEVLCHLVALCRKGLRGSDILCRYGGEEFVIVLPETRMEQARDVALRLCRLVAANSATTRAGAIPLTISVGVAVASAVTPDLKALFQSADGALYVAKAEGRDCVRVAGDFSPAQAEPGWGTGV